MILSHVSHVKIRAASAGDFFFIIGVLLGSMESPPSIMVTRNLWSVRVWVRDWLCKGKTHHPQCTLPKVTYGPAPFFGSKRRRFDKIGNFAEFQFSPLSFNFVQYYSLIDPETSDLMQFSPGVTSSSAPELRAFCNMVLGLGFMQFRP
jgi:hypothetical protein